MNPGSTCENTGCPFTDMGEAGSDAGDGAWEPWKVPMNQDGLWASMFQS